MNAAKDCTLQEKLLRCAMALILAAGALLASVAASPAYAAPSTVDVSIGGKIPYGGFATTWMSADGNIAYCAEPSSPTPAPGSYSTSPVPSGDVTAAIWYSFGSPGFDASMFPGSWYDGGGWDDAKYVKGTVHDKGTAVGTGENLRKAAAQGKMERLKRLLAGKTNY